MIARRVITALTTASICIAAFICVPLWVLYPVILLASCLVQTEFYMIARRRYEAAPVFGIVAGALWLTLCYALPLAALKIGAPFIFFMLFILAFSLLCAYVLLCPKFKKPVEAIGVTLLGFFYVPFLMSFFLGIVQFDSSGLFFAMPESRCTLWILFFIVAVTKVADMGGFAFGKGFGRHKLCPAISPNKTWEGFFGGIFASVLISLVFCWVARSNNWGMIETRSTGCEFWKHFTIPFAVVSGVILAVVGTFGDLIESRFKRECDVKDSATFMPAGLGGFLDMFDSLLFAPALFYVYIFVRMIFGW